MKSIIILHLFHLYLLRYVYTNIATTKNPTVMSDQAYYTVEGKQVLDHGKPFFIKGVCYSPTPIGQNPIFNEPFGDYYTEEYLALWERDFPLLTSMGANTIRVYGWNCSKDHTVFLDTVVAYNLRVIVTFFLGTETEFPVRTQEQRTAPVKIFSDQVAKYAGHPAILAWSYGNEINAVWNLFLQGFNDVGNCNWNQNYATEDPNGCLEFGGTEGACVHEIQCVYQGLFGWIDGAAAQARSVMGSARHLITSSFADVDKLLLRIRDFEVYLPNLDVWGAQIYRGKTFGVGPEDFLTDFELCSQKPLLVTEFGVDSYRDPCGTNDANPCYNTVTNPMGGYEDQITHAAWGENLARLLLSHSSADKKGSIAGGCIMAWIDERWKGSVNVKGCAVHYGQPGFQPSQCAFKAHVDCPIYNIKKPSLCGYQLDSPFDKYVNEGWFGIMHVYQVDGEIDRLRPKKLYENLHQLWGNPLPLTWLWITIAVVSVSLCVFVILCGVFAVNQKKRAKYKQLNERVNIGATPSVQSNI